MSARGECFLSVLFFFFSPKFSVFQRAGMGRRHGGARRRGEGRAWYHAREGPTEAAMTHDAEASITFRMK